jgi:hypothetical protein
MDGQVSEASAQQRIAQAWCGHQRAKCVDAVGAPTGPS